MVQIEWKTEDGIQLSGMECGMGNDVYVLFLPMMPAVKERYESFMLMLESQGISSLAMDFRGHGKSDGGPDGYKSFSPTGHVSYLLDAKSAIFYLQTKGVLLHNIICIGASIGANVALNMLSDFADLRFAIALSPGLDYKGISTKACLESLSTGKEALFIASEEDTYSYLSAKELHEMQKARTDFWVLDEKGHGNEMLESDPELAGKIIQWIKKRL